MNENCKQKKVINENCKRDYDIENYAEKRYVETFSIAI